MTKRDFPQRVSIEITNHCNYLCVMCPQGELSREKGFISPGLYKKIIDECSKYNPMVWNHFIGEPLLHNKLFEMLEYAGIKGVRCGFSTNCSLLDDPIIMKILGSGLERIELSLDALNEETYYNIRGVRNFSEIEDKVCKLLKTKYDMGLKMPVISIQFVKQQKNIHELEKFAQKWSRLLKGKDFVKSIDFITWAGTKTNISETPINLPSVRKPCERIWKSLVILWNGDVTPCNNDFNGELVVGNVLDNTIKDIWESEGLQKLQNAHIANNFQEYPFCGKCSEWICDSDVDKYSNISHGVARATTKWSYRSGEQAEIFS